MQMGYLPPHLPPCEVVLTLIACWVLQQTSNTLANAASPLRPGSGASKNLYYIEALCDPELDCHMFKGMRDCGFGLDLVSDDMKPTGSRI